MTSLNGNNKISDNNSYSSNFSNIGNSLSNNLNSIYDSASNSVDSINSSLTSGTESSGIFGFLKNITWTSWFIIIIVLAILGFNIFAYLATGTQITANILEYITKWFSSNVGNEIGDVAKQTIKVSATGAKTAVNTVADVTNKVADVTNETIDLLSSPAQEKYNTVREKQAVSSHSPNTINEENVRPIDNSLDETLNNAVNSLDSVQADDSYSSIQRSKGSGKSGWCFIGEDKGIRSCVEVGLNDTCMSGDIFPTNSICINPNLRV